MPDQIDLSSKATAHLADLMAQRQTIDDKIALFVTNCAIALDIDESAYAFDTDMAAFVRVLEITDDEVVSESEWLCP